MALNFVKQLKVIDENYKCFVYGYIRQRIVNKYQLINIPSGIIDLCVIFSYVLFEWELETKHKNVVVNGKNNLSLSLIQGKYVGNIYSKTILDAKAIYILTIKVKNHSCGIWGIVNADQTANDQTIDNKAYFYHAKDGYGYGGAFGFKYKMGDKTSSYGSKLPKSEVMIEITFNKIKGELSYKSEEENLGIAWRNIDIEKKYRFAVYVYSELETHQVMDFQIKWE